MRGGPTSDRGRAASLVALHLSTETVLLDPLVERLYLRRGPAYCSGELEMVGVVPSVVKRITPVWSV
jgi:hypothetical protein